MYIVLTTATPGQPHVYKLMYTLYALIFVSTQLRSIQSYHYCYLYIRQVISYRVSSKNIAALAASTAAFCMKKVSERKYAKRDKWLIQKQKKHAVAQAAV